MRKITFLMMFLFILCATRTTAQTDYYYYNGNKIPLTLNENKICVNISKGCEDIRKRILENATVMDRIRDDIYDIFIIMRSDFESLTPLDFWKEDIKSVLLTPTYYSEDGTEVYAAPYINVRLKKGEDIDLLTSYAEKCGFKILKQASSLMPLWYILVMTQDCDKTPLECANYLWESGEFAASVPDLCAHIDLDDKDLDQVDFNFTGNNLKESPVHDIYGRLLNGIPLKGVYIRNGRKYVR